MSAAAGSAHAIDTRLGSRLGHSRFHAEATVSADRRLQARADESETTSADVWSALPVRNALRLPSPHGAARRRRAIAHYRAPVPWVLGRGLGLADPSLARAIWCPPC